ncbi:MAG: tetratricopeptide repeat protein [Planctomycetota bacterium]|nr:tetratricopeptide repeat protein [Planctomycetota bacterium]
MDAPLRTALRHHERGRLDEAARGYQAVLAGNPASAPAWHLLGVIAHQRGDHSRAIELIGRAIEIEPRDASFHANLAEAWRALGQFENAARCCQSALALDPGNASAANNLGLAWQGMGKLADAISQYERTIQSHPDFALAHNNLGNTLRQSGRSVDAVEHFQTAIRLDPNYAAAHSNLGQILLEQYRRSDALWHCQEAVRLCPGLPEAQNNLGNVLRELGRLDEARACYTEALRLNPGLALTCNNLGQTSQEQGAFEEALRWYQRAERLDPDSARIHSNLGGLFNELEQYENAERHFRRALEFDPSHADAHHGLGWIKHDQGQFHTALGHYREAIRLRPDFALAHCSIGTVLQELGDLEGAERSFRESIRHDAEQVVGHAQLATLLRGRLPDADREKLVGLIETPHLTEGKRALLRFGLAHVADAQRDYALASQELAVANTLTHEQNVRRGKGYDPAAHDRLIEGLISTQTREFFERVAGLGNDSETPVFIMGLPRSGTTLTEQILASHSQVFGAGELGLAGATFHSLPAILAIEAAPWECAARLGSPLLGEIAQTFLAHLRSLGGDSSRVVDNMPDNYLFAGLIAALFPKARIIHCRRDLRDIAVSCWMTNFRQIRWANRFDHIATRFHAYQRIMAHWRATLPVPVLEIDYESTVADLEGTARRLIAWVGLEWESGCATFHEQHRPVRTASLTQVRQPVYSSSVARWKNYEPALGELFGMLRDVDTE